MAESIGDALASGCADYITAGTVCLLFLLSAWLAIVVILFLGIRDRSAVFQPVVVGQFLARLRLALGAKSDGWYKSLIAKWDAVKEACIRGEWLDPHEKAPVCK